MFKDFDAARREATGESPSFQLGGETFQCVLRPTLGDIVEVLTPREGEQAVVMVVRYVRALLANSEEVERFNALLKRRDDPIAGDSLVAVSNWLSEQYTENPTDLSANSSGSVPKTGEPSSPASSPEPAVSSTSA